MPTIKEFITPKNILKKYNTQDCAVYRADDADRYIARINKKRCMAMAQWCETTLNYADSIGWHEAIDFYCRWYEKWLKLAEHYKTILRRTIV